MMRYRRLTLALSEEELAKKTIQYHFQEQKKLFLNVYQKLVKQCNPVVYYEHDYFGRDTVMAVVSLGIAPDRQIQKYQEQGEYLSAYAVECVSMALLSCAYEKVRTFFYKEKNKFLNHMDFFDQEELPEILTQVKHDWKSLPIQWNEACAIFPSKTVVFRGTLEENRCHSLHDCSNCGNKNCIFRTTGEENGN